MVRAKIVGYEVIDASKVFVAVSYKKKTRRIEIDFLTFTNWFQNGRKYVNIEIKKHKLLWFEWETWRLK